MRAIELQAIREAAGLTQVEFAERLGVHPVTLSKFERDREPITKTVDLAIHELGRRLGVDVDSLIKSNHVRGPRKLASKRQTK